MEWERLWLDDLQWVHILSELLKSKTSKQSALFLESVNADLLARQGTVWQLELWVN